jgi:hypothetical protein
MHDKHRFSEEYLNKLRGKIEASKLLKALEDHVLNGKEMSQSQVQAANVLLRKVLPELNATEITEKSEGWTDVLKRLAGENRAKLADLAGQNEQESAQETPTTH